MRSDRERLLDILEAIEQIEKYVGKGGRQLNKTSYYRRGSSITYRSSERPPAS